MQIDPCYHRPIKAKTKLGWIPEITLDQVIVQMVANDLGQAKKYALLNGHSFSVTVGKE